MVNLNRRQALQMLGIAALPSFLKPKSGRSEGGKAVLTDKKPDIFESLAMESEYGASDSDSVLLSGRIEEALAAIEPFRDSSSIPDENIPKLLSTIDSVFRDDSIVSDINI